MTCTPRIRHYWYRGEARLRRYFAKANFKEGHATDSKSFDGHLADEELTRRKLLLPRCGEPGAHAEVVIQNNNFK